MSTKYEFWNTGDDDYTSLYGAAGSTRWMCQSFPVSIAHTITSVKLKLSRSGLATGNATVEIFLASGNLPTGAALATGTYTDVSTISTSATWYEITLGAGALLAVGSVYCIVISCPLADPINLRLWYDSSAGYADGRAGVSTDNKASWDLYSADNDFVFEEWGDPVGGVLTARTPILIAGGIL